VNEAAAGKARASRGIKQSHQLAAQRARKPGIRELHCSIGRSGEQLSEMQAIRHLSEAATKPYCLPDETTLKRRAFIAGGARGWYTGISNV
jgi:hypothetical protein